MLIRETQRLWTNLDVEVMFWRSAVSVFVCICNRTVTDRVKKSTLLKLVSMEHKHMNSILISMSCVSGSNDNINMYVHLLELLFFTKPNDMLAETAHIWSRDRGQCLTSLQESS